MYRSIDPSVRPAPPRPDVAPPRPPDVLRSDSGRPLGSGPRARPARRPGFWSGIREALGVMGLFVLLGLVAADGPRYPEPVPPIDAPGPLPAGQDVWLVDGFNLLHASVLRGRDRAGWWQAPARARVLALVESVAPPAATIRVVFDGDRPASEASEEPLARIQTVFAPSADDWIVRTVRTTPAPDRVTVVTSDRQLAARARHAGSRVLSSGEFARTGSDGPGQPERS